jgi:23S rRNA (guanosine2251-2'-O)-methyltransferase
MLTGGLCFVKCRMANRVTSMSKTADLIFGINPVLEMLKASPREILEIVLAAGSDRPAVYRVCQEAQRHNVRLRYHTSKALDQMVGGQRHQGVVARVQPYHYFPFAELIERIALPSTSERVLVLDGLTDPRNFGALLRTADATGVRNIIVPKDRSADVTPIALKASAGAAHHVNIVKVTNLRRALRQLKKLDYWVIGLDAKCKKTIYETSFPHRLVILLGNEGVGVRPINLRECDFTVSIPMLGQVSSLNVSVAGAVFLYELVRQGLKGDRDGGGS